MCAGFLKHWKLASLPQLTGRTVGSIGAAGAPGRYLVADRGHCSRRSRRSTARATGILLIVAAVGIALSQALIIFQWRDARVGTIANVLFDSRSRSSWGPRRQRFQKQVDDEVRVMFASAPVFGGPRSARAPRAGTQGAANRRHGTRAPRRNDHTSTCPRACRFPARRRHPINLDPAGASFHANRHAAPPCSACRRAATSRRLPGRRRRNRRGRSDSFRSVHTLSSTRPEPLGCG